MSPDRLLLVLLTLEVGCPVTADDDATADDDSVSDDDTASDDDTGSDDDDTTPIQWGTTVTGVVVDPEGAPLPGLPIALCHEVCFTSTTQPDGRFTFLNAEPMSYVLENLGPPEGDSLHWSKFFDIVEVVAETEVDVGQKLVPFVEETLGDLSGTESLELMGGAIVLEFDADAVDLPPGVDELGIGATPLPEEAWPQGGLDPAWEVIAAVSFVPWDATLVDGFQATIGLPEALPDGTPVGLYVADYEEGRLSGEFHWEDAELAVGGASLTTVSGLDRLTMLLVVAQRDGR